MKQYCITGPIYDWVKYFLRNRKQVTIVVDGEKSAFNFKEVGSGVPQGIVWDLFFYNLCYGTQSEVIKNTKF